MKVTSLAVSLACLALHVAHAAAGAEFFVSTSGTDSNPGTASQPFATLHRAQAAARAAGCSNGATVLVEAGRYFLNETLSFGRQDSGCSYAAAPGVAAEDVVVSGGTPVPASSWRLARPGTGHPMLRSGAGPSVWQATLPIGTPFFRQMWANGMRQTLARTATTAYVDASKSGRWLSYSAGAMPASVPASGPHNPADVTVVTYESWTASVHPLGAGGIDINSRNVSLATPFNTQWAGGASGKRFYVQGMKEAMDTAGEFYYDRESRVLSWMPPDGVDPSSADIIIPRLEVLINVTGDVVTDPTAPVLVDSLSIANLTFAHSTVETASCFSGGCDGQSATFLTTAALLFKGVSGCSLEGVRVAHVGGYGVWLHEWTHNCTISRMHATDLGAGGVRFGVGQSGVEPTPLKQATGNLLTDSTLLDGGHWYQEGCGVLAQQVKDTAIVHNEIGNFSYTGVSVGWTWGYADTSVGGNTVAYNYIHDIGLGLLSDMGCVYTLGRQPGTVVDHNICEDVTSYNYGGWGYYTDEGSSNMTYSNNLAIRTKCAGIHQHYGTNNVFHNNVLADVNVGACDGGVRSSQHPGQCSPIKAPNGACSSFELDRNIVVPTTGPVLYATIPTGFVNMTLMNQTYFSPAGTNWTFPGGATWSQWQAAGKDATSVRSDPQFSPAGQFATVASTSPALTEGFVNIDTSSVGPRSL